MTMAPSSPDSAPSGRSRRHAQLLEQVFTLILGGVAAISLLAMMFLTFFDVIGRYVFNSPIQASYEITQVLLGISVFAALPLTTLNQQHVTVPLLDPLFRGIGKSIQQFVIGLISFIALAGFAWRLWDQTVALARYGDTTLFLKIPYPPLALFMSLMCASAAAVVLVLLYRQFAASNSGRPRQ